MEPDEPAAEEPGAGEPAWSSREPSAGGSAGGADTDADTDVTAVLAANQAFYDAFEAADLDAMSAVWEHSDRVVCTHPGWATLRGWSKVSASWFAIFRNPARLQVILTEPRAVVVGDCAWVSVDENLLGASAGPGSTVAALNLFVRRRTASPGQPADASRWLLVAHHGSGVVGS